MYQTIKSLIGKKIILRDPEVGRFIGEITFADTASQTEKDLFGNYEYKAMLSLNEASSVRPDETNPYVVLFEDIDDVHSFMKGNTVNVLFYWYINTENGLRTANSTGKIHLR